jgi:hypothetical protein
MLHSQRLSAPENSICTPARGASGEGRQPKRVSKGVRSPKEGNGNRWRGRRPSLASQPWCPRKSPMGTLCTRKRSSGCRVSGEGWLSRADLHLLMAREGRKGSPVKATVPVAPEERLGGLLWEAGLERWWGLPERMADGTHATWPRSFRSVPLALLTEGTATAMAHSGGRNDSSGSLVLKPSFCWGKRMVLRTAQRPIGLEVEGASRQTPPTRLRNHLRGSIAGRRTLHRSLRLRSTRLGRSKRAGAHGSRMKSVT